MVTRRSKTSDVETGAALRLDRKSIAGSWSGDPGRVGMQFESIRFSVTGDVEAHIVTMCTRGFCPSVQSNGTFEIMADDRILLTLDGIGQEFIVELRQDRLFLRDPVSGMTKTYSRTQDSHAPRF